MVFNLLGDLSIGMLTDRNNKLNGLFICMLLIQ
jgi:hypothetical protein